MKITPTDQTRETCIRIMSELPAHFAGTRFAIGSWHMEGSRKPFVKLSMIRLTYAKPYCGNHPALCETTIGHSGQPRRGRYLEGLDWVEFNDRINDLLDSLSISARVETSVCVIRKGVLRRVHYSGTQLGTRQANWTKDESWEHYRDYTSCSPAPASTYPLGTPGEYCR